VVSKAGRKRLRGREKHRQMKGERKKDQKRRKTVIRA